VRSREARAVAASVFLALSIGSAALSACASQRVQLASPLTAPLQVVVLDSRPKVVSREYASSRTGTELTAPGVEKPSITEGAIPLAHVLFMHLKESMPREAELLREVEVLPSADPSVARSAAVPRDGDLAGLLFVVLDWHATVAAGHRNLRYDVTVEVIDGAGKTVASSRSNGNGEVSYAELPANAEIFNKLLNDPAVAAALAR